MSHSHFANHHMVPYIFGPWEIVHAFVVCCWLQVLKFSVFLLCMFVVVVDLSLFVIDAFCLMLFSVQLLLFKTLGHLFKCVILLIMPFL